MVTRIRTTLRTLVTKKSIRFKKEVTQGRTLLMKVSLNTALDLKILSPTEPVGLLILFLGLIFTGMIFYIIYAVSSNKESLEDKKIRTKKELLQQDRIDKLFPKKK